ncbi:hypothetical protein SCARD494_07606 [Seiridium cardinale]
MPKRHGEKPTLQELREQAEALIATIIAHPANYHFPTSEETAAAISGFADPNEAADPRRCPAYDAITSAREALELGLELCVDENEPVHRTELDTDIKWVQEHFGFLEKEVCLPNAVGTVEQKLAEAVKVIKESRKMQKKMRDRLKKLESVRKEAEATGQQDTQPKGKEKETGKGKEKAKGKGGRG